MSAYEDIPGCDCVDGWLNGYGFFIGGDPRDFTPDDECCTKEEIDAWREACKKYREGDHVPGGVVIGPGFIGCGGRFGIGTYRVRCFDAACAWKRGEQT